MRLHPQPAASNRRSLKQRADVGPRSKPPAANPASTRSHKSVHSGGEKNDGTAQL